jgi:hypothetical protein
LTVRKTEGTMKEKVLFSSPEGTCKEGPTPNKYFYIDHDGIEN